MTALPSAAKRAEAAIQYFEDRGRKVTGVTIKGSEFKLDFAAPAVKTFAEVDLTDMSK